MAPPNEPPQDRAWGSMAESGQQLDALLQFVSSVAFARAGTALMKISGFQVLDGAGTGALKQACEGKPPAASVGLVSKTAHNYIASGPQKFKGPDGQRSMGFTAFNSMSGGAKSLSLYFPLTAGVRPTGSTIRTSAVQSPLWKLPTRMLLGFNSSDEVDARLEWLDDIETARDFKTATWVTQDRYLSMRIDMAQANWIAAAVPALLINCLKFRLNAPFEGSGSLWWQGYPEVVTPSVAGLAYTLTTPTLPIFSASKTDWNKRGHAHTEHLQAPGPDPSVLVDYTWMQPKYDKEPSNFLRSLPLGFDSLPHFGLPAQLGFLYSVVVPKELFVARTHQLNDKTWLSAQCNIKPPIATPSGNRNDSLRWKGDKDSLNVKLTVGHNISENLSMSLGYRQLFNYVGLDSLHETGASGVGLQRSGGVDSYASLVWRFAGGQLQVAAEGVRKLAVSLESRMPTSDAIRLRAGFRWSKNERLHYGAGITAEL